ncbi:MAG: ATP synthase F1 subunit gamma [Clostridiales bacterium]|jgi:F-type H+-transporting ATPase subunit gamma|nr:ATP synthase F1 subunit gamma [Clostridiales bacterium]
MQKANEIRHRISANEEIRKITNAMYLVSTSRLRRVLQHIEYNNKAFRKIQTSMKDLLEHMDDVAHPYFTKRSGNRCTYIVIAGDKGLAGSYNSDVLNLAMSYMDKHGKQRSLISVGLVTSEFFRSHSMNPDIEVLGTMQDPTLSNARRITFDILEMYDKNLTDEVHIIYTSFFGETKNKPVARRLLPLMISDYNDIENAPHAEILTYEPSANEVFSHLVPQYLIGILFGAIVQSYAAEHYARMNAMQSATKNADEMLSVLKMKYNMARQTTITQEIIELADADSMLLNGETQ